MLGVTNLANSLAFYRDKLGLNVVFEAPGFAFVSGSSVTLGLNEPMAKQIQPIAGAVEIVFGVPSVQKSYALLVDRGVQFTQDPRAVTADGKWAANFNDPDGHRLSIFGAQTSK
jgi:catechol 2,3-dioxygenase-like lactoylglutathione lyase family enzyme